MNAMGVQAREKESHADSCPKKGRNGEEESQTTSNSTLTQLYSQESKILHIFPVKHPCSLKQAKHASNSLYCASIENSAPFKLSDAVIYLKGND